VAAVPILGGTAAELWAGAIAPVILKKQVSWFNGLAERVHELGEQLEIWAPENLAENEAFGAAVLTALEAVRRTSDDEKITALRNAVLNTVAMVELRDFERTTFMQYVADLEPIHLQVLKYAIDPREWFASRGRTDEIEDDLYMGGPTVYFDRAFPDLPAGDIRESVLRELIARGLSGHLSNTTMTGEGARQPWGTDFGRRFAQFVEEPER